MPLDYLPILAEHAAPRPPRRLRRPPGTAWQPLTRALGELRVSLLTSAAVRHPDQRPFPFRGDASHRRVAPDPSVELSLDHHSPVGADARRDPEVVFPRHALRELARKGLVGGVAPGHFSMYGGIADHDGVINRLGPALARKLKAMKVDLAVMVPY